MIRGVLRTPLCEALGVDVPIIGAPFGPWEQVDLAAAICKAGALGSVGTARSVGSRSVPRMTSSSDFSGETRRPCFIEK